HQTRQQQAAGWLTALRPASEGMEEEKQQALLLPLPVAREAQPRPKACRIAHKIFALVRSPGRKPGTGRRRQ
ncbi:MAG: hypothetical protein N3A66_03960, partial [Planctomycetota bacterium]|nr:hypothetical protein [Planctomycetota bacterium]